jgi:thiol-disulfide isomerase/thioredoxin
MEVARMRRIIVTAALGLALSAGGCAAAQSDDAPGTAGAPGTADTAIPRDSLAVATLTGETFDAAASDGEPVILWFWAPWCTICRAEAPDVAEVAAELEESGSPVTVLGVPGRGGVPEMEDFVADTGTGELTHLVDAEGTIWREYGVITQPAFALLGADGQVEVINGALGADGLRDAAERLAEG